MSLQDLHQLRGEGIRRRRPGFVRSITSPLVFEPRTRSTPSVQRTSGVGRCLRRVASPTAAARSRDRAPPLRTAARAESARTPRTAARRPAREFSSDRREPHGERRGRRATRSIARPDVQKSRSFSRRHRTRCGAGSWDITKLLGPGKWTYSTCTSFSAFLPVRRRLDDRPW